MHSAAQLLEQALTHQRSGRLAEAESLYRQILAQNPQHADALHLLGVLASQVGKLDAAVALVEQALAVRPHEPIYLTNLGDIFRRLGHSDRAVAALEAALQIAPGNFMALNNLGLALQQRGQGSEALAAFNRAIQSNPRCAEAYLNAGTVYESAGDRARAEASYRKAVELEPNLAAAHNALGALAYEAGRFDEAEADYRAAIECQPGFGEAYANLATLLSARGQIDRALEAARQAANCGGLPGARVLAQTLYDSGQFDEARRTAYQALALYPGDAGLEHTLALVACSAGRLAEAAGHCRNSLAQAPTAEAYNTLGTIELAQRHAAAARDAFERALDLAPKLDAVRGNLAGALALEGRIDEAKAWLANASDDRFQRVFELKAALLQPVIPQTAAEVDANRRQLLETLDRLEGTALGVIDPVREIGLVPFHLAYGNVNERETQARLASFYQRAIPSLAFIAPHCLADKSEPAGERRIEIGFFSQYFGAHTIGRLCEGWIRELDRRRFRVSVLRVGQAGVEAAREIDRSADAVVVLPNDLAAARRAIAELRLDVLCYADVGLDAFSYFMAFARLAPVQCAMWGHPVTTGIPAIDYFVSGRDLEPADGASHYSEHLLTIDGLPSYYHRPNIPPGAANLPAGLSADAVFYLCPQSLFKLHPDFDAAIAAILRANPRGHLGLVAGEQAHWNDLLIKRWGRSCPDVLERVHILPRMRRDDFLRLLAAADVILDPLYFSGGNTSYEALAAGTPIVTLPGDCMRGRVTYAMYRRMDFEDLIARDTADYIRLAVELGTNGALRNEARGRIRAVSDALFDDRRALADFERQISEALAVHRIAEDYDG